MNDKQICNDWIKWKKNKMLLNLIELVQLRTSFLGIIEGIRFDMSKVIKLQVEWMIRGIWNDQKNAKGKH